jgi:BirA family biotin operon repressor/biotin-[acetyl-CoA-carboxylase] ligase
MRASIIQILRERGDYVSGEELSSLFKVSRTAIWKHIHALKQTGYEIEAHSRRGYRFRATPDRLLPQELQLCLNTSILGRKVYYFDNVDSTNNEAKKLAAAGCPEGTIVVAEAQDAGRGRKARGWYSPFGKGVWVSLVLRPAFSPQDAPKCTLLAAVAVNNAIRKVANFDCGIKWPNDILYDGKKLVGILTEMTAEIDAINYVVVGLGINVNLKAEDIPPELQAIATSLEIAVGHPLSRIDLLAAVLEEFERLYQQVQTQGFQPILDEWRRNSITLGNTVDVLGSHPFSGVAVDIDADGALLVRTDRRVERVLAGDVSIRARAGGNSN